MNLDEPNLGLGLLDDGVNLDALVEVAVGVADVGLALDEGCLRDGDEVDAENRDEVVEGIDDDVGEAELKGKKEKNASRCVKIASSFRFVPYSHGCVTF